MATLSPAVSSPALTRIDIPGTGPEDVVLDREGRLVAGLEDGRIVRIDPSSGGPVETLARVGGRPLGLEVCADGRILICDSPHGLLRLDPGTGGLETLVERFEGRRLIFCSNVVEARDGTIYFSTSSSRYSLAHYERDIAENVPTGQLFRRQPGGRVELVLDRLHFANGLAFGPDQSWLAVAETNAKHVTRLWLTGPKAGQREIFARMAGFPDNISASPDGLIWVAIASPEVPALAKLHAAPMLVRSIVARLPKAMRPAPLRVGWLMAFDNDGTAVHDYRWTDGTYAMFTGIVERDGVAYIGSLGEHAILRLNIGAPATA
jgi:sugar lactone lactonase YvrE